MRLARISDDWGSTLFSMSEVKTRIGAIPKGQPSRGSANILPGRFRCVKRTNYRRFSHNMMRLESEIFIDGVFREFCKKDEFCLTVHDGIFFKKTRDKIQLAEDVLRAQIKKKFSNKIVEKIRIKQENTQNNYINTIVKDREQQLIKVT